MYVARREIKAVEGNLVRVYRAGDTIPDFEKWEIHARRAHINLEWVEEVKAVADGLATETSPTQFTVTLLADEPVADTVLEAKPALLPGQCSQCGKEFKSRRALTTHVTKSHR